MPMVSAQRADDQRICKHLPVVHEVTSLPANSSAVYDDFCAEFSCQLCLEGVELKSQASMLALLMEGCNWMNVDC